MYTDEQFESVLQPTFKAALEGDVHASQSLLKLFIASLKNGNRPHDALRHFFLLKIQDPDEFASIMKFVPKKRKSRPSIDDKGSLHDRIGIRAKKFFGTDPSEKNALMVAYLVSLGHRINETTAGKKESAVVILSRVIRRSPRSLQRDYYRHKASVETPSALALGELYFKAAQRKR